MSMSKYLLLGLSGFLYGCALLAGLDERNGDLGPVGPTPRDPSDPASTSPQGSTPPPPTTPEVVTPASGVVAMATDDDAVYYAVRRELRSVAVSPGSTPRLLLDEVIAADRVMMSEEYGPHPLQLLGVAVNRARVFVVDDAWGRVFACPKTGCTHDRGASVRMTGLAVPNGQLAVDDSLVVWGELLGIGISTMPFEDEEIPAKYGPTGGEPKRIVSTVVGGRAAGVWLTDKAMFYGDAPRAQFPLVAEPAVADFALKDASGLAYGINVGSVLEIDTKTGAKARFADVPGVLLKRIVADAGGIYVVGERPDRKMDLFVVKKDRADLVAHLTTVSTIALGSRFVFFADDAAIYRVAR